MIRTNPVTKYLATAVLSYVGFACQAQINTRPIKEETHTEESKSTCAAKGSDYKNFYRYQQNYIPTTENGIKYVKISLHIWNDHNGMGTFQDTPQTHESFVKIFNWVNGWHEFVGAPSDPVPGAGTITDTRIRFVLDPEDIYFYKDSLLNQSSSLSKLNRYVSDNHPERLDAVLIHFTNDDGIGAGHSSGTSFNNDDEICAIVTEMRPEPHNGSYSLAQHLFHELAHSFGLHHTYNSEQCRSTDLDFLWDVFDTTAVKNCKNSCSICYHTNDCKNAFDSPTDFCTNNIMTGKGSTSYWTSPLQAGRMHRCMHLNSIRQYCWGYDPVPHEIKKDETWDFSYKSYRDIIVKSGSTLTITCDLQMIPEAKIIVEPGGKLVVDGGKITAAKFAEGDRWAGIELISKSKKQKAGSCGELIVTNKGMIEKIKENCIVITYKTLFKKNKRKTIEIPVSA